MRGGVIQAPPTATIYRAIIVISQSSYIVLKATGTLIYCCTQVPSSWHEHLHLQIQYGTMSAHCKGTCWLGCMQPQHREGRAWFETTIFTIWWAHLCFFKHCTIGLEIMIQQEWMSKLYRSSIWPHFQSAKFSYTNFLHLWRGYLVLIAKRCYLLLPSVCVS